VIVNHRDEILKGVDIQIAQVEVELSSGGLHSVVEIPMSPLPILAKQIQQAGSTLTEQRALARDEHFLGVTLGPW